MVPIATQLMISIAFLLHVKLFGVLLGSLKAGDWISV